MNPLLAITERTKKERRHLRLVTPRPKTFEPPKSSTEIVQPYDRPKTRAECEDAPRPCPFVGCRHHLYLDVNERGNIKLNFPHLEPEEMPVSCSLDVADLGGIALESVGEQMNITRERTRQIESIVCKKIEEARTVLREFR